MVPAPSDRSGVPPTPASVAAVESSERSLLLLCAERTEAARLAGALAGLGGRVVATPFGPSALDHAVGVSLVVVDRTPGVAATMVVTRLKADPRLVAVPVLALAQSDSVEERIALLDAGADDVMARPIDDLELAARVEGLMLRTPPVIVPTPTTSAVTTTEPHGERHAGPRLMGFFAAHGGVGTTTLAVNTAVRLANRGAASVALLDLDPWWGQVATHLDLAPQSTIVDLARDLSGGHDVEMVRYYALKHPSGVSVYTSPTRPDETAPLTQDHLELVLEALRGSYDYVVVDGGSTMDDRAQVLQARADRVVVVVSPEIPAVRATRMLLEQLSEYEGPSERQVLVLNHIFAAGLVKREDLRRSLRAPIAVEMPYDALIYLKAVNEGIPLVIGAPNSAPAAAIRRLAVALVGDQPLERAPTPVATPAADSRKQLLRGLRRR
jgi:pilus assembly protein CpaE